MDLELFGNDLFGLNTQTLDIDGENETETVEDQSVDGTPKFATRKRTRAKPKVITEWNEDDVFKLISCVEVEPITWNAAHKDYSNKIARSNAWFRIADKFDGN